MGVDSDGKARLNTDKEKYDSNYDRIFRNKDKGTEVVEPVIEAEMIYHNDTEYYLKDYVEKLEAENAILKVSVQLNISFGKMQKKFLSNGIYDPDALQEMINRNRQCLKELTKEER